jgi:hypothetical protein
MTTFHRLDCTPSAAGLLFECADGCGRRLAVDRRDGSLTVIDRGDPFALHRGGTGDIALEPPSIRQG